MLIDRGAMTKSWSQDQFEIFANLPYLRSAILDGYETAPKR